MPPTASAFCQHRVSFLRIFSRICGTKYPNGASFCPKCHEPRHRFVMQHPIYFGTPRLRPTVNQQLDDALLALEITVERLNSAAGVDHFSVDGALEDAREMRVLGNAYRDAEANGARA